MADIEYEGEEKPEYWAFKKTDERPFFIRLVLKTGIVSTDRRAEYVLLGVAALCIILSFLLPMFANNAPKMTPQQLLQARMAPGMNQIQNTR